MKADVSIISVRLTEAQSDQTCDCCQSSIPKDTPVLGKIIREKRASILTSRFSPTCLACVFSKKLITPNGSG